MGRIEFGWIVLGFFFFFEKKKGGSGGEKEMRISKCEME